MVVKCTEVGCGNQNNNEDEYEGCFSFHVKVICFECLQR